MKSRLRACPCGNKEVALDQPHVYRIALWGWKRVICGKCGMSGPWRKTEKGAVAAWNRRAGVKHEK